MAEMEGFGCIRCGSFDFWSVQELQHTEIVDEVKQMTYKVHCEKCGRDDEWTTDKEAEIPERVRIREELFKPEKGLDSKFHNDYGFNRGPDA